MQAGLTFRRSNSREDTKDTETTTSDSMKGPGDQDCDDKAVWTSAAGGGELPVRPRRARPCTSQGRPGGKLVNLETFKPSFSGAARSCGAAFNTDGDIPLERRSTVVKESDARPRPVQGDTSPKSGNSDESDGDLDIPSDGEAPPLKPPSSAHSLESMAPPAVVQQLPRPWSFRRPTALSTNAIEAGFKCYTTGVQNIQTFMVSEDSERDDEWSARARLTGTVARMVQYSSMERPIDDIFGLQATSQGRIILSSSRINGPCARAGVAVGDQLVCIDGKRDFNVYAADTLIREMKPPAHLIFLGFVGKLQAEVRVKQPDQPRCGMSPEVALYEPVASKPGCHVEQCETVIFTSPPHSMMITARKGERDACEESAVTYELKRDEARRLVHGAIVSEDGSIRTQHVLSTQPCQMFSPRLTQPKRSEPFDMDPSVKALDSATVQEPEPSVTV